MSYFFVKRVLKLMLFLEYLRCLDSGCNPATPPDFIAGDAIATRCYRAGALGLHPERILTLTPGEGECGDHP